MKNLHVAVAQICSRAGDINGNLQRIERQAASAAAVGVEVILFAETSIHGYDFSYENLRLAEPLDGPIGRRLLCLAKRHNLAILAGFLQSEEGRFYNSHMAAWPCGRLAAQQKHNLTPMESSAGISAGPRARTIFEFSGVTTVVLICADTGIQGISENLVQSGVEYRFIPTAGGGVLSEMLRESDLEKSEHRNRYVKDREKVFFQEPMMENAVSGLCGFASANALGFDGRKACHRGHCMIVDNRQVLRAQIAGTNILEHQQDQMVHAVLSFP